MASIFFQILMRGPLAFRIVMVLSLLAVKIGGMSIPTVTVNMLTISARVSAVFNSRLPHTFCTTFSSALVPMENQPAYAFLMTSHGLFGLHGLRCGC